MGRGLNAKSASVRTISALALAAGAAISSSASAAVFFDWEVPPEPTPSQYIGVPELNNSAASAAAVQAYWAANPGKPKTLRVIEDLSDTAALNVFRNNTVSYVFGDFEGLGVVARTANLAAQVRWNPITNSLTPSAAAFVGNYQVFPVFPDATQPYPGTTGTTATAYYGNGYQTNMAMEQLYPGSPSFRGPGTSNGGSTSPNIRSNLFTMPIQRFSTVEGNLQGVLFQNRPAPLPAKDVHIPLITRFNNWGNAALDNTNTTYSQYSFDTSIGGNANQLLARGDFAAMVAHYRARGADGYNLYQPGVIGYTKTQMQDDALAGWNVWNPLTLGGRTISSATLDIGGTIDGTFKSFEQTGMVYSGMFQDADANPFTQDLLWMMVSNLDGVAHSVSFNQTIGGAGFTSGDTFTIAAGDHRMLEFVKIGGFWDLAGNNSVTSLDSSGNGFWPDMDRNGVGIPEPTTFMLTAMAFGLLLPRRRRQSIA